MSMPSPGQHGISCTATKSMWLCFYESAGSRWLWNSSPNATCEINSIQKGNAICQNDSVTKERLVPGH